jgi:hypothetical protein
LRDAERRPRQVRAIDTLQREEAGDTFFDQAERAGVPTDQAERWFDEREF